MTLGNLAGARASRGRLERLRVRPLLVANQDQLTAALALIEVVGIARRFVLFPPDFPREQVSPVALVLLPSSREVVGKVRKRQDRAS